MSLSNMIQQAITGAEASEEQAATTETRRESGAASPSVVEGAEKLAAALRFVADRGVESFVKVAWSPENNMNMAQKHHTQSQVAPNSASPPMSAGKKAGSVGTNEKSRPGGGSEQATVGEKGKGSHHSALSSNEAAINYTKTEKAKQVAPALDALLDARPFADPKVKENLSHASGVDKNIKTAGANGPTADMVRQELARRIAQQGA